MLVLTRRVDEKIRIGDDVFLQVLGIEGGVVKLGIDAPKEIKIFRMEILEQVTQENVDSVVKNIEDITEAVDLLKNRLPGDAVSKK